MDIKGCTTIVTGGTGGLGNRLARKFAEAGANIALVYKESDDKAEEIAAELRGPGAGDRVAEPRQRRPPADLRDRSFGGGAG